MDSSSSSNCGATNRNARSGIAPASGARAAPSASSVAARPERRVEIPAPTRREASRVVTPLSLSRSVLCEGQNRTDARNAVPRVPSVAVRAVWAIVGGPPPVMFRGWRSWGDDDGYAVRGGPARDPGCGGDPDYVWRLRRRTLAFTDDRGDRDDRRAERDASADTDADADHRGQRGRVHRADADAAADPAASDRGEQDRKSVV